MEENNGRSGLDRREADKRPPWWKRLWQRSSHEQAQHRKPLTLREFWGKTLWDWMELLIVPLAIAIVGIVFANQQDARQRELEEQRTQDVALQGYLDEMGTLVTQEALLEAKSGDPVYILAQARTAAVVTALDAEHNASVMRFLTDLNLAEKKESSISLLENANLQGVSFGEIDLRRIDMSGADLSRADLSEADLEGADLSGATLIDANLNRAWLAVADLSRAKLYGTNLSNATLIYTDFSEAQMVNVDLSGANLSGVDLSEAKGITQKQIESQAKKLKDTTMPDGSKQP